ncbi:hypothetical protein VP01_2773g3 [Puccinia sorghi]|uniref:DUF7872 domain-containing protein n=1 Tax=Puccinia sorghi TaxID=27349 RepID=A0A0L6V2S4_9BASI|nr:hypothetical protein VP01_2773g3 [Puccinia sorghi]
MHLFCAESFAAYNQFIIFILIAIISSRALASPSPYQTHPFPSQRGSLLPRDSSPSPPISFSEPLPSHNSTETSWGLQKRLTRSCEPLPLSPATWKALELDSYLQNYPNGQKLTLADYVASKNASNFICGIGSICDAGQMCYPVTDQDWYILFALQQWNSINNMLFMAIGYAISIVQGPQASVNSLISTFPSCFLIFRFPALDTSGIIQRKQSLALDGAFTEISGTLIMDTMILVASATGPIGWAFNVINFGMAAGFAAWAYQTKTPEGPLEDGFSVVSRFRWTQIVYYLSSVQDNAQALVSEAVTKAIKAPISSKDGIYGVLKAGAYLSPAKMLPIPEVADRLRQVTLAMCVNLVLRSMNAFITVGADVRSYMCTDKGPNGAWPQKDRLSYCPRQGGPMYNIVRAVGDKTENNIPNAKVLNEIFGFSTKVIIDVSLNCQAKYHDFNHNPYKKGSVFMPFTFFLLPCIEKFI